MKQLITVSIVYALPQRQWLQEYRVPRGSSAEDLIQLSSLCKEVDELRGIPVDELTVGIYGEKVDMSRLLEEGDRLEIYRPLQADPKEVRRQLALLGKTMGKKST
jgi:putative ubiquitin-RnfH superfamily antitoxin RatB of RatAB toxin-antitoxin module